MWNMRVCVPLDVRFTFQSILKQQITSSQRLYITHKEQVLLNKLRTEVMFSLI